MVRRPLCVVLAAFAGGIVLRELLSRSLLPGVLAALCSIVLLRLVLRESQENGPKVRRAALAAAAAGMLVMQTAICQADADPYAARDGQVIPIAGTVLVCHETENGVRMILETEDGVRLLAAYYGAISGDAPVEGCRITGAGSITVPASARNPGGYDEALYLKGKRIYAKIKLEKVEIGPVACRWRHTFACLRKRLSDTLSPYLGGEEKAMLEAMLFGDKSSLPDDLYESFQRNGTAHVLAVSGLHVGMLYALYRWLLGRRQTALGRLVLDILLLGYAALAGFSASVVRAVVMILVHVAGQALHARYDMLTGTCFAAALILLISPYQLFAIGFQLSFLAVFLLAFLQPFCKERLLPALLAKSRRSGFVAYAGIPWFETLGQWVLPLFFMQAGMVPITAYLFQYFSPLSFIANIPLVFLAGLIVPCGILLLFCLLLPLGAFFVPLGGCFLSFAIKSLLSWNRMTYLEGAFSFDAVSPPRWAVFLFYLCLFLLLSEWTAIRCVRKQWRHFGAAFLLLCALALFSALALSDGFGAADVVFVDVGQGDCVHIRGSHHTDVLVDGGGRADYDVGNKIVRPYLLKNGVRSLDAAFVTHLDTDHYGGVVSLCRRGMVKQLLLYEGHRDDLDIIAEQTGMAPENIRFVAPGDSFTAGGVTITVLGPLHGSDSENEQSLVLLVCVKGRRFLLTGDIGAATEAELTAQYAAGELACDILQVPHHGSRYSSSPVLLAAARPGAAVIQVGVNQYGHPSEETLARYQEAQIAAWRNDQAGAVGVDVKTMRVHHMLPAPGAQRLDAEGAGMVE